MFRGLRSPAKRTSCRQRRRVYELAGACAAPSTLVIYQGGRHGQSESKGAMLGPPWRSTIGDWLLDRVSGGQVMRWVHHRK